MSASPIYNETELLHQIADGSKTAFNTIVDRYWNKLFQVGLTYIKSPQAAEDIVQDVFLKLWQKREKLVAVENLENYLFIITRNEVVSAMRKKGPVRSIDSLLANTEHTSSANAEEMVLVKKLQELLHAAVNLLPAQQQAAWKLREEGLTQEEIAERMDLSKNTVKVHIVRALNFVRTYLETHSNIIISIAFIFYLQKM